MKRYVELVLECCSEEMADIATAFLADYDFETFDSTAKGDNTLLHCYILADSWAECRQEALAAVADYAISIEEREIEDRNWNERWESENFSSVAIDDIMVIRAPHCPPPANPNIIDIVVAPRMSFGSGHHNTTRMMCRLIARHRTAGSVLDVGCGTGVLSIAALKCGAERAVAIDIDQWSTESAKDAARLNGVESRMQIILGVVQAIEGERFDMVVANINRNIILADAKRYSEALNKGGRLLVSGFLSDDIAAIEEHITSLGFALCDTIDDEGWVALAFEKL